MLEQLSLAVTGLFATGATMMAISHRVRVCDNARCREDWIKYGVYAAIIVGMLLAAYISRWLLAVILFAITVVGSLELKRKLPCGFMNPTLIALPAGLLVKLSLGHLLLSLRCDWFASFAFIFMLVSINDSFAQLWGRLLGHHKLCSRLSPGKTIEGLLGGSLTTVASAVALAPLIRGLSETQAAGLGCAIAAAATAGDLLFSLMKRTLIIKDFSGLLPGHGGIFDRFDSLIVAAPVAYWLGRLLGI
jgi:phosphatidate cytidylyltransferase